MFKLVPDLQGVYQAVHLDDCPMFLQTGKIEASQGEVPGIFSADRTVFVGRVVLAKEKEAVPVRRKSHLHDYSRTGGHFSFYICGQSFSCTRVQTPPLVTYSEGRTPSLHCLFFLAGQPIWLGRRVQIPGGEVRRRTRHEMTGASLLDILWHVFTAACTVRKASKFRPLAWECRRCILFCLVP